MNTPTTLVMAYYDNPGMLKEHYAIWKEMPDNIKDLLHVVIVDDCSKHAAWKEDVGLPIQIYRMKKDVRWNQDACRNIGVKHAETDWVFLTDMDHIVPPRVWNKVLLWDWDRSCAYTFRRVDAPKETDYKPHPNTWFMSKKLFDRIGGYDERFAGYYGTDADFRDRLRSQNAPIVRLKESIVRVPRSVVHDASTTSLLRKQPEDREGIARIKRERAALPLDQQRPLRDTFEYERVA